MNWIDLIVLLLVVLAGFSGARQGMVIALPAFVGVLIGAVIGVLVTPLLIKNFSSLATRVALAVAILVLLIALGEALGVWCGRLIKRRIRNPKLAGVDNALGAVVQGIVVLVVAWMIAVPLTVFNGWPGLESEINHSVVLGAVNSVIPQSARALPNDLRNLFNVPDLPAVVNPFQNTPNANVGPPDTALQNSPIVQEVEQSVLKVRGEAPSCSRALEGSGFVVAPQHVLTNAHVVAGTSRVSIDTGAGELTAHVVWFDYNTDIAILYVPRLTAPSLQFDTNAASSGQNAIVLGYPLDGPYTASAARVRQSILLNGPNIYNNQTVDRGVYTVRAQVRSGNSGGPLLEPNGEVYGVVFGAAVDDSDTGYALTAAQVEKNLPDPSTLHQTVSTDQCTS